MAVELIMYIINTIMRGNNVKSSKISKIKTYFSFIFRINLNNIFERIKILSMITFKRESKNNTRHTTKYK